MIGGKARGRLYDAVVNAGGAGNGIVTLAATVLGRDSNGTAYVHIPGGVARTPLTRASMDIAAGDTVMVDFDGVHAVARENTTNPSAGVVSVSAATSKADAARAQAERARVAADSAVADAAIANAAAASAKADARTANGAANSAIAGLSVVEDVAGTVTWLADHGTYTPTADTAIDPNKTYWTPDADTGAYSAVASPSESGLSGYYELSLDETVTQYVASHLALTDDGLHLTADGAAGRLLLSPQGVTLYGADGKTVATFGESISFADGSAFAIGTDEAYILFTPASYAYAPTTDTEPAEGKTYYQPDGEGGYAEVESPTADGMAGCYERSGDGAAIAIGGSNVAFADTPLSERLKALSEADAGLESRVAGNEAAIGGMQSLISIDAEAGAITLGGANSATARLGSDSLDFNTSAGTVATIGVDNGEGVMDVTRARIGESLEIGAGLWAWTPRGNGNLTLRWIGGE